MELTRNLIKLLGVGKPHIPNYLAKDCSTVKQCLCGAVFLSLSMSRPGFWIRIDFNPEPAFWFMIILQRANFYSSDQKLFYVDQPCSALAKFCFTNKQ
jgi:hypothetical protein